MIRTIFYLVILFGATLFLPFWIQITLYLIGFFIIKHKVSMLAPALFADIWYAPSDTISLGNYKTFLIILGFLIIYFLISKTTRVREKYDFEKK
ncbi:MAG: hypothetical protein KBC11_00160 [Candidatus Pacebacteria bacterium]|nr:hypothetical protein [Candidatus Paceibacterota bacterium]